MTTIGSSTMAPHSLLANLLLSIEVLCGLTGLALVTGLAFAKFTRPTACVRFSRFAVVSNRHGIPSLMFRMANERENQLLEARVHVVLIRSETAEEGERVRRFYDLELLRDRNALFALGWTAIHPITERSPLFRTTPDSLVAQHAVVVVSTHGARRNPAADGTSTPRVCRKGHRLRRSARRYSHSHRRWVVMDDRFGSLRRGATCITHFCPIDQRSSEPVLRCVATEGRIRC